VLRNTGFITVIPLLFVEIFYLTLLRLCYENFHYYSRTHRSSLGPILDDVSRTTGNGDEGATFLEPSASYYPPAASYSQIWSYPTPMKSSATPLS